MASEKVVHLTDDSFDEQTESGYVMIDFWAEWCGPCRALASVIDSIAESHSEQIKVCKLDVDSNQRAAVRFGIRGIPTVIMMKDGKLREWDDSMKGHTIVRPASLQPLKTM